MQKKQTTLMHIHPATRAGSWERGDDPSTQEERLLTADEVARILHVSRSTIYGLIRRGDLPFIRVRTMKRFRLPDVERFIREQSNLPKPRRRR